MTGLLICLIAALCGCKEEKMTPLYRSPSSFSSIGDVLVAENQSFIFSYTAEHRLVLKDKRSGCIYSNVPESYYHLSDDQKNGKADLLFFSPVIIEYFNKDYAIDTAYASDSVIEYETLSEKTIQNGIRVIYYFENEKISIPVEYILKDDGLEVSLLINGIKEGNENQLYRISCLPGFHALQNTTEKTSYMVLPVGSGALMYTDSQLRKERNISVPVYGYDPSETVNTRIDNTYACRLPFFGSSSTDGGLLSVLTDNPQIAHLTATAGDDIMGYSTCYVTWQVRGIDAITSTDQWGTKKIISLHTNEMIQTKRASVLYTPLEAGNNSYTDMAVNYRDRLFDSKDHEDVQSAITMNFLGGITVQSQVMGIHYSTLLPLTSISEVEEILKEYRNETGISPNVVLTGYGEDGLSYGKLCGGFTIANSLGGKKDLARLQEECRKNNEHLLLNFEPLLFIKSAGGFSNQGNVAKKVSSMRAVQNFYSPVSRGIDSKAQRPFILSRDSMQKVCEKLVSFCKKQGLNEVALSSIANSAYSDYADSKTYYRGRIENDVIKALSEFRKHGTTVATYDANAYAIKESDMIFDVTTSSDKMDGFDEDLPLYQIVCKGKTAIFSEPINLSNNSTEVLLKSLQTGMGISFTICNEWDRRIQSTQFSGIALSDYESIKNQIFEYSEEIESVYQKLNGAVITDFSLHEGYSETTFSNGYKILVNFSNETVTTPFGYVESKGYILQEGEGV